MDAMKPWSCHTGMEQMSPRPSGLVASRFPFRFTKPRRCGGCLAQGKRDRGDARERGRQKARDAEAEEQSWIVGSGGGGEIIASKCDNFPMLLHAVYGQACVSLRLVGAGKRET